MATVPTVPNIVSLPRAQDGSIEFWWNPPTSDGGSAITGYTVSCSTPQLQTVLPDSAYNTHVQGLTNGQNYTFFITASNAVGESAPATWQAYQPGFIPSPPTGVGAVQQGASCNILVSRSTPTTSTNTVNYWSVQATPADIGFSTIVQAEYGSNLTTFLTNLDTTQTQWQMSARQLTDPGWSDPSVKTPYIGNNRVRTAFVTNAGANYYPTFDSNGNYWALIDSQIATQSTFLYDSRGTLRQGFGPVAENLSYGKLVYYSADGVTNVWMAQYVGRVGNAVSGFNTRAGFIDSSGNFMCAASVGSTPYVRFTDKNGTQILSNSTPTGQTSPYIVKFSSNGIYNGESDVNTWATFVSTPTTLNVVTRVSNIDTSGNIFTNFQCANTTGGITEKFLTVLDKTGAPIGSTISLIFGATACLSVKLANNGLATNSWRAYQSNLLGPSLCAYPETFQINRLNQLVVGQRYTGADGYMYDKNDSTIGSVIPYASTLGVANYNTLLIRMGVDGTAATSWRASIGSEATGNTNNFRDESPTSIKIDSSNNIILTGFSEFGPTYANTIPLDASDNSNISVTQSTFSAINLFTTRYTNSGTPNWITTIQGVSSAAIFRSTIINIQSGNSIAIPQFTKTMLDSQNNVIITGNYNSNELNMYNNNGAILKTLSSPLSNFQTFIAKYNSDGTSGTMARIGAASTVNAFATRNWNMAIDSSDQIYVSGQFATNLLGFYASSNDVSPSITISSFTATSFTSNIYVARIDKGLSTFTIGRQQISTGVTGNSLSPFHFKVDSTGNCITYGSMDTALRTHLYCLGNNTTTENITINVKPNIFSQNQGQTTFLSKFTSNTTTSWSAVSLPGEAIFPVLINSAGYGANPNLIVDGTLFIGSNNRVYTSLYSSTNQSTIVRDINFSTVYIFQQITGRSVVASTIGSMISYPSDGINRPQ